MAGVTGSPGTRGNLDIEDKGDEVFVSAFRGEQFVQVIVTKDQWVKLIRHEMKRLEVSP